jgi:NTE family protein
VSEFNLTHHTYDRETPEEQNLTFIRKSIAFARTAISTFFGADGPFLLDASDLDLHLFDREARLDEAWESVRGVPVGRMESDRFRAARSESRKSLVGTLRPVTGRGHALESLYRVGSSVRDVNRALIQHRHKTTVTISPHGRRKLGLAFGGGFARALAHIGVLKVLEEERIPVDLVAGTSAGAMLGAAYCAGMSAMEMEKMAATTRFRDFVRMTFSRYGIYASDRMANFCERVLKIKNFEDLKIPLAVTATDVRTGDPVVFTRGPLADPMRASCAFPGMFPPVEVDGRSLIDGMLAYSVPTTPLREMGADYVIGVYLSADRSPQPVPRHIFEVIAQCLSIADTRMCNLWKKDADLVVEPDIEGFSFDCFDRAQELIANGEKATRAALPQLRRLLRISEPAMLSNSHPCSQI